MLRKARSSKRFTALCAILLVLCAQACSKYVYTTNQGNLSQGTFEFLKKVVYDKQFESEKTREARNRAIVHDLATYDAIGRLGTLKGVKKDISYGEYLFRQRRARYGRAAIWYWQNKYKDSFNWQMLFAAEKLDYDENAAIARLKTANLEKKQSDDVHIGDFEGKKIYYRNFRGLVPDSDYVAIPQHNETAIASALRDMLKAWLEKQIHDRLVWQMSADHDELRRYDHDKVSELFIRVKYGMAGEGIYPGALEEIPLLPVEVYDHFNRMRNSLARVLWVKGAYTVVQNEKIGEQVIAELDKGTNFEKLASQYAIHPKFVATAKPFKILGFQLKHNVEDRESRSYYDRLLLSMASQDETTPKPYLGRDGIVVARIYDVGRALEDVKLDEVIWKVEFNLRTKMLNAVFKPDIDDSLKALKPVYNARLIRNLP